MPVLDGEDDRLWEALLARCQLDRGPMPVTVKVMRRHQLDYGTRLHTVAVTVDRETGKRATVERIDPVGPWRGEQAAIQDLHYIYQRVWQHEADEWFVVDGVRVFDPHRGESR